MTRRVALAVFGTTGAILYAPNIARAQILLPVNLLAVRKPGFSLTNACLAPCIRGKIYDVTDSGAVRPDQVNLATLGPALCDTIERPWRNNRPSVSSIPVGVYAAAIRDDASKSWMTNLDRRWRLQLQGVPHRSFIQFHYGQDVAWSEGCFIVGDLLKANATSEMDQTYCSVSGSEAAVARIRAAVMAPGRDASNVQVAITDDAGVFPNVFVNPSC